MFANKKKQYVMYMQNLMQTYVIIIIMKKEIPAFICVTCFCSFGFFILLILFSEDSTPYSNIYCPSPEYISSYLSPIIPIVDQRNIITKLQIVFNFSVICYYICNISEFLNLIFIYFFLFFSF